MPKLKVGILLDSLILPAWAFNSLERVVNIGCVDLSLIILNNIYNSVNYESNQFYKNHQNIAYRWISKIDQAIFWRAPDAFAPKNVQELLPNVPILTARKEHSEELFTYIKSDMKEIESYQLDILVGMGLEDLPGEIHKAARYGVWTYYHGDPYVVISGLPGFWEVINRIPETGSILFILNNDSGIGKVLYRSWAQTFPFSPIRNRNRCFWECSPFLSRQIELLYQLGEEGFFNEIEKYSLDLDHSHPVHYKTPSNFLVLWLFIKLFARDIREAVQRIFQLDHWRLLFDINKNPSLSYPKFKEIIPPKDRFWADPHIIQIGNKFYIFIEEYIYKKRKGQISIIEMSQDGSYKEPFQILSKDYHLSYPFVFDWNNQYYMIPETSENRTIELYECIKFPNEWKFKMNLMENVIAVDTTLFYDQQKWWLFTGITENEGALPETELFLFYATELFTSIWTPHTLNPIISDVKKARPAGRIFKDKGHIYRPSQDCSKRYGWGFDINEILLLSESGYLEKTVTQVRPDWDNSINAIHTLSQLNSLTIIDACKKVRRILGNI